MPRNHNPGTSTLRNRNRVTNKTRLKVIHGTIDVDALDTFEDDAKASGVATAGLDQEDANEHHIQAVLSAAASQRSQVGNGRSARGGNAEKSAPPAVFIPVPDSTGIVDNYEELYPPKRWKDPATYIRSSETVEEICEAALANSFTYFMDERDKEWLDKNNEEARGEGTSAQGALSASTTRANGFARSAKSKGKEPDVIQPITMSEDEFELVMGLFEKCTHERTEFLHHSLETGMAFPAFSDYQDMFASPIVPATFAAFVVPAWVPHPVQLLRLARVVYPYWKERRLERGGQRIIPTLNADEADTLNESYVCFRRREIKAVRKTRATQVTFTDKLIRLQAELSASLELAKAVLNRENLKRESAQQAQNVWDKRLALVELKRKFSALGEKADEELLHDKERPRRPPKESRLLGLKLRTRDIDPGSPHAEALIRPKERTQLILNQIEKYLLQTRERDHHWDDLVDNIYQRPPVPYPSRLFKYIAPAESPSWPTSSFSDSDEEQQLQPRAVRLRFGRGGRLLVDRRHKSVRVIPKRRSAYLQEASDQESEESNRRLAERWKFDEDDYPSIGPQGPEEQDRMLVDDYDPKYLRHHMTLLQDQDQFALLTDASLVITTSDNRQQSVMPIRLGLPPQSRREIPVARPYPPGAHPTPVAQSAGVPLSVPLTNGTPISMATQMKKVVPPGITSMRISSNNGMRPPVAPLTANIPTAPTPAPTSSPPHMNIGHMSNGVNGVHSNGINGTQNDAIKTEVAANLGMTNGMAQDVAITSSENNPSGQVVSPIRPKSQNQHHVVNVPNGYHIPTMNGYGNMPNGAQYMQHPNQQQHSLSMQQMQTLKSAFAVMPQGPEMNGMQTNGGRQVPQSYMTHVVPNGGGFNMQMQLTAGSNINLKLPASRQMQWSASTPQRPTSVNGIDGAVVAAMNGSMSPSPNLSHSIPGGPPVRTPSANGSRAGTRGGGVPMGHVMGSAPHMSPHLQHSPSPMPSISQSQSPPRPPLPTMTMASPLMPHQQPVGSSQSGY